MIISPSSVTHQAKASPVQYTRQEVVDLQPRWDLVRDCVAGQAQVKKRRDTYLPRPNGEKDEKADARYNNYLQRAIFYGVTGRTLRGLVGLVFGKDPVCELPELMEISKLDIDGGGVGLNQQARKTLGHGLQFGRAGLLTDYPVQVQEDGSNKVTTRADLLKGDIKPTITLYDPWDVINWRVALVGGKLKLTLVVIDEKSVVDDDGFKAEVEQRYRVLRLVEGRYLVEIWEQDETKPGEYVVSATYTPTDSKGNPFDEIPFTFVGPDNNDPTPDLPPLYDLAVLNIGHYVNSADHEESCFMVGQPTPVFSGLTKDWVDNVIKKKVYLGPSGSVCLPQGGAAILLQAQPNTMVKEAMELKEVQMVKIGARLISDSSVQKTATEASADKTAESSVLANLANNVSDAYTRALKWAARFIGATEDGIVYTLANDFAAVKLSAQEITSLVAAWQANILAKSETREIFRKAGLATLDDDEFQTEIDEDGADLGSPVLQREQQKADEAAKVAADAAKAKAKQTPPAN